MVKAHICVDVHINDAVLFVSSGLGRKQTTHAIAEEYLLKPKTRSIAVQTSFTEAPDVGFQKRRRRVSFLTMVRFLQPYVTLRKIYDYSYPTLMAIQL